MANVQLKGKITEIKDSETFGNFEKRVMHLLETEGQYPNTFLLEAQQAYCSTLDQFSIGDEVECSVDIRGRAWDKNGRSGVINTLRVWKIVRIGSAQPKQSTAAATTYNDTPTSEPVDDLPF